MTEEIAEQLDGDTQALIERWDGRPDLFIEDVFRVRDLETKEVSPLDLTDYQRQFVHAVWYGDASTTAVLKGRRTGYSFIACCVCLAYCLTTPHAFIAITGPSKSQAKDRIDDIYDLVEWSRLDIEMPIDNRDEIEFWNGATVMAFAGNPDTSRGADSADILFIDEMAFLDDQEESMRAFSPFVALGDASTIEISTPNTSNDLFMQDIDRGSEQGENGIIAIEQPAFENPDDIDVERSLLEQDVEPAMPYLNIEEAEKDRARDPKGFEQEYLCKTVEDSYRFFTEDGIERAMERGGRDDYVWHPATHARHSDGKMIMGVDIAAGGSDDTALAVFEHHGAKRYLRFHTVVGESDLRDVGITGHPKNPSDLASYISFVSNNMGVDRVFLDKTGVGEGFNNEINKALGRMAEGFDFDDKDEIERMMGDFNRALYEDLVTLYPDDTIGDQLKAIVKEKNHRTSKPKFSGKEQAPNGKDDMAFALVLGAYPPNFNAERGVAPQSKDNVSGEYQDDASSQSSAEGEAFRGAMTTVGEGSGQQQSRDILDAQPTRKRNRTAQNRQYGSRHSRRGR